ncbi:MAG: class I SAM-dependent methyltransferase [Carboxydocellales bacterium]
MNLFEQFSLGYEQMINWDKRLEREAPVFQKLFADQVVRRVLDLGCGPGNHAVMFASWGLEVVGIDPSGAMVERAKAKTKQAGVKAEFLVGDFLNFTELVQGTFDVVVILGNSLPHLLKVEELEKCLQGINQVLTVGGTLVIQNRNYDKVLAEQERFMPLNTWSHEGEETLFLRFMDLGEEVVNFNIVTMTKCEGKWDYQVLTNPLRPILVGEMDKLLADGGWKAWQYWGDFNSRPFSATGSTDLIVVARKKEA